MKFSIKNALYGGFACLLCAPGLHAAGVVPDTSVVFINEASGEGSITVKNTDTTPVLLYTKVSNLADDPLPVVVATQPVARVEAGQSQRVRFLLSSPTKLDREHIKRVSFEGIPPTKQGTSDLALVVRQDLPMLIVPASEKQQPQNIKALVWSAKNNKLTVTNTSLKVIRFQQNIKLMPASMPLWLEKSYILPGETLTVPGVPSCHLSAQTEVIFSPVSRYGKAIAEQRLSIHH